MNIFQYNRAKLVTKTYKGSLTSQGKVLDVGCGDGILTDALSRKYKLKVTGCDVEKFLIKPLNFVLMKDKNKLPFPNLALILLPLMTYAPHVSLYTIFVIERSSSNCQKECLNI